MVRDKMGATIILVVFFSFCGLLFGLTILGIESDRAVCKDAGFDKVGVSKTIDGIRYIKCSSEEIVNGQLITHVEWVSTTND